MKVYCITIYGNEISEKGYENLVESSKHVGNDFEIEKFPATHGQYADIVLKEKDSNGLTHGQDRNKISCLD